MKVLLIGMGTEVCFIRNTNLVVAAFAALKADGSIMAWGDDWGGTGAPSDKGYTKIYSNVSSFAALKADGSIKVWGAPP
jgi:hypothetical protein